LVPLAPENSAGTVWRVRKSKGSNQKTVVDLDNARPKDGRYAMFQQEFGVRGCIQQPPQALKLPALWFSLQRLTIYMDSNVTVPQMRKPGQLTASQLKRAPHSLEKEGIAEM
jgi:hypothetical protein